MAATSTALTQKVESGSPYQLDQGQVLKASRALLKHMKNSPSTTEDSNKRNLLEDSDTHAEEDSEPVWLTLTTKTHIIDTKRLKPALISVPHPLRTSPTITICLITADPQRTYKDIIASPTFPPDLSKRITRIIGVQKIQTKYKTFEAQRQLLAEHDVFLADDRIITRLSKLLGKTFYRSTAKRPIPLVLQAPAPRSDGKRIARAKSEKGNAPAGTAQQIAREIEKALKGALVHLSASTNTAIRVGYAGWDEKMVAENVEVVAKEMIERFVPKKWRGVRGIHVKGNATAALPIWLADELWVDEGNVVEKAVEDEKKANVGRKRKATEEPDADEGDEGDEGNGKKKSKNLKALKESEKKESDDGRLDKEIALRKETLRKQKEAAARDVDDEVPKSTKIKTKSRSKSKKAPAVEA